LQKGFIGDQLMNKELLTIEFRYNSRVNGDDKCITKTITIGIYNTIDDAVAAGNNVLEQMSDTFEIRPGDKFRVSGLFGFPDRLVSNSCYPTKGVVYYAKITPLSFKDINDVINTIFTAKEA